MNNKVVYTLYQIFLQRGFACMRFNFRGVGRSPGTFARGEGELSDAAAALDWLQSYNENATAVLDRRFLIWCVDRDAAPDAAA